MSAIIKVCFHQVMTDVYVTEHFTRWEVVANRSPSDDFKV